MFILGEITKLNFHNSTRQDLISYSILLSKEFSTETVIWIWNLHLRRQNKFTNIIMTYNSDQKFVCKSNKQTKYKGNLFISWKSKICKFIFLDFLLFNKKVWNNANCLIQQISFIREILVHCQLALFQESIVLTSSRAKH